MYTYSWNAPHSQFCSGPQEVNAVNLVFVSLNFLSKFNRKSFSSTHPSLVKIRISFLLEVSFGARRTCAFPLHCLLAYFLQFHETVSKLDSKKSRPPRTVQMDYFGSSDRRQFLFVPLSHVRVRLN